MVFKPGQSGNPKGRPKGSRVKLQEDFVRDFCTVWEKKGLKALDRLADEDPAKLVQAAVQILPKEQKLEIESRTVFVMPEDKPDVREWLKTFTSTGGKSAGIPSQGHKLDS